MYRSIVMAPAHGRRVVPFAAILTALVLLWFGLSALATPFDHDESQYIAGAYFSGRMTIFRDFLYLQPPLHAWIFAPISLAFPDNMVVAMRLVSAAIAVATLGLLWAAQRAAGVSRDSAAIATVLIGTTAAFQFAGAVVRNDMLPTLLCAAAMIGALRALREPRPIHWGVAGLFFGLAIAAKLSFAPVGIAAGLFVLTQGGLGQGGRCCIRATSWLAGGAILGMGPLFVSWAMAPDAFFYGVVTFAVTGPFAWYAANGASADLTLAEKVADLLKFLVRGPAIAALLLVMLGWRRTRAPRRAPGRRLAQWMLCGGLLGAALPTPTHVQYLMPLLPPLALALGYLLDDARHWRSFAREATLGLLCLFALPGLAEASIHMATMARDGSPILAAREGAQHARMLVRRLSGDDRVVTLSPHHIIDAGLELDPRFAAGPFVYRTGWTMTEALARKVNAMTPATLKDLDRNPPDAILVGYEDGTRKLPMRPDDSLINYARSRAYRMIGLPDGQGKLYIKTRQSVLHPRNILPSLRPRLPN